MKMSATRLSYHVILLVCTNLSFLTAQAIATPRATMSSSDWGKNESISECCWLTNTPPYYKIVDYPPKRDSAKDFSNRRITELVEAERIDEKVIASGLDLDSTVKELNAAKLDKEDDKDELFSRKCELLQYGTGQIEDDWSMVNGVNLADASTAASQNRVNVAADALQKAARKHLETIRIKQPGTLRVQDFIKHR